ncbi:Signal transduction histidine kinase [Evansella caseinilytica]|uniref:histidine kinase n=1 Tax=Evansella caseinilytica TaxID=1503961 RepID=A0A1H3LTR8_9BACI|nr:HAMP domain-containing sensor histidine kinase [Evansella caseinilytica]SDY67720.1 Signal transduction histidine kinase [Evansella caseinilytica]
MLRNREFLLFVLSLCFIGLAATGTAAAVSPTAAVLVCLTAGLLIACCILYTRWRYREIAKLSGYLRQIIGGDYSLDVRDNREGELSILKNDIYKVTLMLSEQSALLQRDKRKLTEAISDISHQLKTPLTSMTVMADLLSDANLTSAKRAEFTQNIRRQLERIDWLVSSLLKLSKIDAGAVRFKKQQITVKTLIQKAVEPLLIPLDIKQQRLTVTGEDTASFSCDLNWTAEALINILKNCIEHTEEGGVVAISFSENPLFTEIVIADNGKGIAQEDIPHIFKRFYKGKSANEDSVGIGLAMAHSIVTSQSGTIEVKSHVNAGTQFRLIFYKQVI